MPVRKTPQRSQLQPGLLEISGLPRQYWLAVPPLAHGPLLVALHGLGMSGPDFGECTRLAQRGPAAGFATVFPDGWGQRWDGEQRDPSRRDVDDPAFIAALVEHLASIGVSRPGAVVLAGLSNGAFFAELLARRATVDVALVALVAGTTKVPTDDRCLRPAQSAEVICIAGSSDRVVPYDGGPIGGSGLLGRLTDRRGSRRRAARPIAVGAEVLALEWAATNGVDSSPQLASIAGQSDRLPVTRLSWSAADRQSVHLYRIDGGGHGWPGGPQYRHSWVVGPISKNLDATGIILDASRQHYF